MHMYVYMYGRGMFEDKFVYIYYVFWCGLFLTWVWNIKINKKNT